MVFILTNFIIYFLHCEVLAIITVYLKKKLMVMFLEDVFEFEHGVAAFLVLVLVLLSS